jgi:hypothetical protein
MSNELRRCDDCINQFQNGPNGLILCEKSLIISKDGVNYYMRSDAFRKNACGVSGVYFEPAPTEAQKAIFDGIDDEKPKSRVAKIETRETF